MKKKASLWISGITTVAMLAVAVGSFAAWDNLTAAGSQPSFTVNTGSPKTVAVASTPTNQTKTLVPTGAVKTNDNVDEVEIGRFTATAKEGDNAITGQSTATGVKLALGSPSIKQSGTDVGTGVFDITVTDGEGNNATVDDLNSGTEYTVKIKFKESSDSAFWTEDNINKYKGVTGITVDYTITATPATSAA
ncbi:MAG: hypothetical protein EUB_00602 [Eubacterium sp.]|uniref:hypothetical protein n=1 Tax=Eubacterium sp. TaxID=142586 RepID=UPI00304BC367